MIPIPGRSCGVPVGLEYNMPNGWRAVLYQAQRELIETEMRPGVEQRFNVWTDPSLAYILPVRRKMGKDKVLRDLRALSGQP